MSEYSEGMYELVRKTDVTGVSGTGVAAEVAIFSNGKVVVAWQTGKASVVVWDNIEDMLDVHVRCHPDTTELVSKRGACYKCGSNLVVLETICPKCHPGI